MPNLLDLYTKTPEGNFKPKIHRAFVCLLAGESGSGKDNIAASFPKPMYVLDIDHRIAGMQSAVEWLGLDEMKQIDYEQVSMKQDIMQLDATMQKWVDQAKIGQFKYKTIYIASLTSLAQMVALYNRTTNRKKKPGEPGDYLDAKLAIQVTKLMVYNVLMPLQEYGVNVIVAGHVAPRWGKPKDVGKSELVTNEVIGERLLGISDAYSEEIPGYFDNVLRVTKEISIAGQVEFKVSFEGDLAKTAFPTNGTKTIDVTRKSFYNELVKIIDKAEYKLEKK